MKKIVLGISTLMILSRAACGNSGGATPGKQAITPRKVDTSKQVQLKAAGMTVKEGENPDAAKKGPSAPK